MARVARPTYPYPQASIERVVKQTGADGAVARVALLTAEGDVDRAVMIARQETAETCALDWGELPSRCAEVVARVGCDRDAIITALVAHTPQTGFGAALLAEPVSDQMKVGIIAARVRRRSDDGEATTAFEDDVAFAADLSSQVANGGFSQYFINRPPQWAQRTAAALARLGIGRTGALLAEALDVAGSHPVRVGVEPSPVPKRWGEMQREAWPELTADAERRLGELDQAFYENEHEREIEAAILAAVANSPDALR
jgi:hypothetical protein